MSFPFDRRGNSRRYQGCVKKKLTLAQGTRSPLGLRSTAGISTSGIVLEDLDRSTWKQSWTPSKSSNVGSGRITMEQITPPDLNKPRHYSGKQLKGQRIMTLIIAYLIWFM